jgi:hypothetical protein
MEPHNQFMQSASHQISFLGRSALNPPQISIPLAAHTLTYKYNAKAAATIHIYGNGANIRRHAQVTRGDISNPLCLNFHKVPQQPLSASSVLATRQNQAAKRVRTQKVLHRGSFSASFCTLKYDNVSFVCCCVCGALSVACVYI